ncbi:lipid A biosynthesis lauroyl acyltransferase [Pseudomarimonas salicorniae]|uniref:Lipid A biosynthesis lauroyl acyltransferase n=1 Tax=Pseudomarimonas salicorniae TaxID=2933270 RepID=A0ABT0GD00_9GAMM|nr:lipid A biosynthesis lauroyl acyltransferase [Lysobacter sp. CAU 1642]MCK7592411.1 lipid A biosynthesis lauroyl acyltransferase [Lysobacter sp. CAU 1642]
MTAPNRWLTTIARTLLGLLGALPLAALQRLAAALAWCSARLDTRESRVARVNVALCFARRDAATRKAMHRATLRHTACAVLECARIWTRPAAASQRWIVEVHGRELLDAARADGRGVIVAAPHLGNWELFGHYLAACGPLSIVYREPQWGPAGEILLSGRGGDAVEQLPAQPSSVRKMLKALKDGRILGILPDQQPKVGEGEFAPFFGRPALTMTLLSRLAARAGVEVVFGVARRLPDARGFAVHFLPALPGIADPDPGVATAALNAGVEACVALAPEQYQWTYKRFSRAAPGLTNPYLAGHAPAADASGDA